MNQHIKNRVVVYLVFTLAAVTGSTAQTDSVPGNYFTEFQKNLGVLANSYFFTETNNFHEEYKWGADGNFSEKYQSLNPSVFPGLLEKAPRYFRFFATLPETDKKNLVRLFSFYEKDFEKILGNNNLPLELKYLAPALSAMNGNAVLETQAGVWQLTHFQAVLNGGEVTRLVDERLNVLQSTQLAVIQLKENLIIFGNVERAVIAFICGNVKLKNVLAEVGENASTGEVLTRLPENVSDVVAAFQAIKVFLEENRFVPAFEKTNLRVHPDTVFVFQQMHFQQIEKVIGVKTEQVLYLNPQYKYAIVPESLAGHRLVLPAGKRDDFVLWNDSINEAADSLMFRVFVQAIEYPPAPTRQYAGEPVKDLVIEGKTKIQYRLKTGDVLGIIAEKYDVDVADLKYWNNINNERRIQAGQRIDIFVPDEEADYYRSLEKEEQKSISGKNTVVTQIQKSASLKVYEQFDTTKKIEHVVKSGESPYIIARQYAGVTPELILEWNNIDDPRKIQIGQKLIIYPQK